jgi:hypothetical protein
MYGNSKLARRLQRAQSFDIAARFLLNAAPADYWDTNDLKSIAAGGLVNEDVMQKIWDISKIPLPFTDRIGSDTCKNSYTEWTQDELGDPDLTNAVVSGADASGNDAAGGARVGNHCQNSVKVVAVTERAQSTDNIGRRDELAYQLMMRQQELRRDVEAIALSPQASVADNNNATAGKAGGFDAWIATNASVGATPGAVGGFNTSTKVVDAPVAGDGRALTMTLVKAAIEQCYLTNGDPTVLMSVPQITKRLNTFILANPTSASIATPTANVQGSGGGVNQTAQGYVNVLVTDFGTSLEIVPNRLQQVYDSGDDVAVDVATVFLIDTARVALSYLKNYVAHPLAKLGLSERKQLSVDWTVKVYVEKAHATIRDIIPTSAVTA